MTISEAAIEIISCSHGILIDISDFFAPATSAAYKLHPEDLVWVLPIYAKYGSDGMNAISSFIFKQQPMKSYISAEFLKAYQELEEMNPEIWTEID